MPPTSEATVEAAVEKKSYQFPFTLGADPEFTVVSGTRPVNAREILKTFIKGFPETPVGFTLPGGEVGWDGHNATGELRPSPGNPREVTANFKAMLTEVQKLMPFVDLTTLTIASATGGHIHLSVPEDMNRHLETDSTKWRAIKRALASFILAIMLSENHLSRKLRLSGGSYGSILDFRTDQRFTHPSGAPGYTLEVRSANAEWITTEKVCLGTLAYAAIVWDSIIRHERGEKSILKPVADILFPSDKAAREGIEPVLANMVNLQKLYLNKIKPFIRSHAAYPEYKDAIELVLNPERAKEVKKAAHYSVTEGWKLTRDIRSIKSSDFTKEDKIEDLSSRFPENVIRNLSQFAWNDDVNVQAFATALGKRSVALGWKPSHEYFLFGLKKGIDALVLRDEAGEFLAGSEIMKTKKDYDVIKKKFERLEPKAAPAYGRFIHPRTGELMSESEMKRVMIGIPYEVRQKMDFKSLIRLVLKYEKNPKALPLISRDTLADGESQVDIALKKGEAEEQGFDRAIQSGDKPRELKHDVLAEVIEMREMEAYRTGEERRRTTVSDTTALSSWIGLTGNYGICYADDLVPTAGARVRDAESRDIMCWFVGGNDTIVNFGQGDRAWELIADIFDLPQAILEAEFNQHGYRNGARILLGNGGNFRFNAATKDARISALIN